MNDGRRQQSYGQDVHLTAVDRFGVWLSARQMRRHVPGGFAGKRVGDIGCGYQATFARSLLGEVASLLLVDVSLAPELETLAGVRTLQGGLPEVLAGVPEASLDVVVCNSVLEHLTRPDETLHQLRRLTAPGGVCLVNVPSWRGKRFLELSAFRLRTSPACEMDDHKMYYDVRDLWPLLVRAGFRPSAIRCFTHKFGLNTFAVCGVEPAAQKEHP